MVARLVNADGGPYRAAGKPHRPVFEPAAAPGRPRAALCDALDQSPAGGLKTRTSSLAAFQLVAEANDLYLAGRYRTPSNGFSAPSRRTTNTPTRGRFLVRVTAGSRALQSGAGTEAHRQALNASLRAVELNPNLYEAQVSLALAYRGLFQYEPAAQAAQRAIDLNPRLPEAYEILGSLYSVAPYGPCTTLDPELAERLLRESARARSAVHHGTREAGGSYRLGRADARRQLDNVRHGAITHPSGERPRDDAESAAGLLF